MFGPRFRRSGPRSPTRRSSQTRPRCRIWPPPIPRSHSDRRRPAATADGETSANVRARGDGCFRAGCCSRARRFQRLQAENAPGLGPAAIVANAHADDRVTKPPDPEAVIADVEIALFEMLKRSLGQMVGMARQMDL